MYQFPTMKTITGTVLVVWLFLWMSPSAEAQSADLSLAQAQQQALQNALAVKNARYDAEIAELTTRELLGIGLPQLSGRDRKSVV